MVGESRSLSGGYAACGGWPGGRRNCEMPVALVTLMLEASRLRATAQALGSCVLRGGWRLPVPGSWNERRDLVFGAMALVRELMC